MLSHGTANCNRFQTPGQWLASCTCPSLTHLAVITIISDICFIECAHCLIQVRVHLADGLLCPVVGDYKFGGPLFRAVSGLKRKLKSLNLVKSSSFSMCLHAYEICIPDYHRNGVPLVIRAPPPASFCRVARQLMLKLPHPRN